MKYVPKFIKRFVDLIPIFLFRTLAFLGLAEFSEDINKANTFRSRIIWEEAKRRGVKMEQVIFLGRPLDQYRAIINGRNFYFESIPIQPEFLDMSQNWDDKVVLKREFKKHNIPIPDFYELSPFTSFNLRKLKKIFSLLHKPVIIKPRVGSRGRHTVTNINTLEQFKTGIDISKQIGAYLVAEEHLKGSICRATFVGGELVGFYRGDVPYVVGDGKRTILELIKNKDAERHSRIEPVHMSNELYEYLARSGYKVNDVLPVNFKLLLSHRSGRFFGGETREMLDDLHPSFVPILKKATKITGLSVVGFDCIIPDPRKDEFLQRWGIIECNTLPFIDLHYYALYGKPKNIAGKIWDLWN